MQSLKNGCAVPLRRSAESARPTNHGALAPEPREQTKKRRRLPLVLGLPRMPKLADGHRLRDRLKSAIVVWMSVAHDGKVDGMPSSRAQQRHQHAAARVWTGEDCTSRIHQHKRTIGHVDQRCISLTNVELRKAKSTMRRLAIA